MCTPGATPRTSSKVVALRAAISAPPSTDTLTGASSKLCARFVAVTTTPGISTADGTRRTVSSVARPGSTRTPRRETGRYPIRDTERT